MRSVSRLADVSINTAAKLLWVLSPHDNDGVVDLRGRSDRG